MKGRSLMIGAVLTLVAVACAGTDLTETRQESETTPATEATDGPTATVPESTDETQQTTTTAGTTETDGDTTLTTSTSVPAEKEPQGSDTTVFGPGNIDKSLQPFIDQAITDLAGRLGVTDAAVTVLSAVLVVWPDTGLGCPQPDMVYQQVPQDGSLIELRAGGKVYRYHTGGRQYVPFLCEQPMKQAPPIGDQDL